MNRKRIVIIGGVAGGASTATRLRRLSEDAEIIMVERGENISFANCGIPYHIGGVIKDRDRLLVVTADKMYKQYRVDVKIRHEAIRIDPVKKEIVIKNLASGDESILTYDALVLSPGAMPIRPPIPGIESKKIYTLRNLSDMDAIIAAIGGQNTKNAVIIGGGYIGLEMAEALRERNLDVTLVELSSQVMNMVDPEMASPLHQQLKLHGVKLRLGKSVKEFHEENDSLLSILSDGEHITSDIVILAIGVRPEVTLARDAGLKIGELGGIVVNEHMQTSDPNIYAIGDVIEVENYVGGFHSLIPLAGPASRQGRIAADNICGRPSVYQKTQGTAICKVFDLAIGITGLSEKVLKKEKIKYAKVYVHPASHASYYPGASPMTLKLIFDPDSGKVLGAQAVGSDGIDKHIDVLATAIRGGMRVMDLKDLELCYAPPYGSAKDPVNYAGFVASNVMQGDVQLFDAEDAVQAGENRILLDVRTAEEFKMGTIQGAMNIPLEELRNRLDELPKEKEILAFCQVGLRGYVACRILQQHGYVCRNLNGGYKTYKMVTETDTAFEMTKSTRSAEKSKIEVACEIDACALQCPGPIMKLKNEMELLKPGQAVSIMTRDPAFTVDVESWCRSTGNRLENVESTGGTYRAIIRKGSVINKSDEQTFANMQAGTKNKTIVVFSQDLDRVLAAFVIANGAAAMGSEVTLFFTFWGINVLRKQHPLKVKKNFIEKMFAWMMPRGAQKLTLSRLNMGGMGTKMMKGIMKQKNVPSLPEMMASAQKAGVKLVACSMSMDLMGIKKEELIDGVELGGVATYLANAEAGHVNLFI
jgi:NADPH-dependent 2,4-dienoyl-CoA reductase/sulfur reductase-like enzyme/peroxiredoxin family protein/TusA-related sulfurtransferase/rhodanese-related sulfurtransferase